MRTLALAALIALLLVACGTGDEGEDLVTEPGPATSEDQTPQTPAPTDAPTLPGAPDSDGSLDDVQTFDDLSQEHVDGPVDYEQTPPVGGAHADRWLNCGFYTEQMPSENAVHSLEHGAVWITYDPAIDAAGLQQLAAEQHVLVTPFEGLPAPVVASAWGVQLAAGGPDDPRLELFVETFANGPQTPEPGAPCDGGIGEPEPPPASV